MSFEDKMGEMKPLLEKKNTKTAQATTNEPRISKSYTLKRNLADKLAEEASKRELTASRYLENILKKEFGRE